MRTIAEAKSELNTLRNSGAGAALDESDVKIKRSIFEGTKIGGKIVMFEGGDRNPSMLISCQNRHISVPLTRNEIIVLHKHFHDILRTGKVI